MRHPIVVDLPANGGGPRTFKVLECGWCRHDAEGLFDCR